MKQNTTSDLGPPPPGPRRGRVADTAPWWRQLLGTALLWAGLLFLIPPVQSDPASQIDFLPAVPMGAVVYLVGQRVRERGWRWSLVLDGVAFVIFGLVIIMRVKMGVI